MNETSFYDYCNRHLPNAVKVLCKAFDICMPENDDSIKSDDSNVNELTKDSSTHVKIIISYASLLEEKIANWMDLHPNCEILSVDNKPYTARDGSINVLCTIIYKIK